jgi:hypothetical protein
MARTRTPTADQTLLTITQATSITGIPERSLHNLLTNGDLPFVRFPNSRRVWLARQALNALIERSTDVRV